MRLQLYKIVEELSLQILVIIVIIQADSNLYGVVICLSSAANVKQLAAQLRQRSFVRAAIIVATAIAAVVGGIVVFSSSQQSPSEQIARSFNLPE
jgi:hypothetical protein